MSSSTRSRPLPGSRRSANGTKQGCDLAPGACRGLGHGEVKLETKQPRLAVTAGAEELRLGAFTEVGHLPLTNCIRGAQVLEDGAGALRLRSSKRKTRFAAEQQQLTRSDGGLFGRSC